jgi:hypothetical protein
MPPKKEVKGKQVKGDEGELAASKESRSFVKKHS